jgi:hypothetical protein
VVLPLLAILFSRRDPWIVAPLVSIRAIKVTT